MCVLLFYFKTLAVRFFSDFSFSLIYFCSVTCFKNLEHFLKFDDLLLLLLLFSLLCYCFCVVVTYMCVCVRPRAHACVCVCARARTVVSVIIRHLDNSNNNNSHFAPFLSPRRPQARPFSHVCRHDERRYTLPQVCHAPSIDY